MNGILRALWCVDSDTGDEVLIDIDTNTIVAKRRDGKIIDPSEPTHE